MKDSKNMAVTHPHAAARVVVTAQRAAVAVDAELSMIKAEPGLNPYHPNQRTKVPRIWSATEWAGKLAGVSRGFPSSS
jgi:hypothetical protein